MNLATAVRETWSSKENRCALLIAACVDWVWRRSSAWLALPLLAALMLSNLVGHPASYRELRLTLPSLVQEIHTPLRTSLIEVTEYLNENAKQDDLIKVEPWPQRDVLMFYLGDKLRFCCMIDKDKTPLPPETILFMGEHLYRDKAKPDWIVGLSKDLVVSQAESSEYELVFTSKERGNPSFYRPELEQHRFPGDTGDESNKAHIYKRKADKSVQP